MREPSTPHLGEGRLLDVPIHGEVNVQAVIGLVPFVNPQIRIRLADDLVPHALEEVRDVTSKRALIVQPVALVRQGSHAIEPVGSGVPPNLRTSAPSSFRRRTIRIDHRPHCRAMTRPVLILKRARDFPRIRIQVRTQPAPRTG